MKATKLFALLIFLGVAIPTSDHPLIWFVLNCLGIAAGLSLWTADEVVSDAHQEAT